MAARNKSISTNKDNPPQSGSRYTRASWVAAILLGVVALYTAFSSFIAYTGDAFVQSDLVAVAPEVAGVVSSVDVRDNQKVSRGTKLVVIDPEPYQLAVDLKQRQIASLEAAVAVKDQSRQVDTAAVDAATAAVRLAQQHYGRFKSLTSDKAISQANMDQAQEQLQVAQATLSKAQAQAVVTQREMDEAMTQVPLARADLAVAQYALARTSLTAPVDGYVNNLTLRPGAYASIGKPLIGIIDDSRWRIVANFKEDVAASVPVGTRVWVWLDSDPWRFLPGRVEGVVRGIARQQGDEGLLPYVAPTTDWIRLRRRFPVTIVLDAGVQTTGLLMGADARVFFFR